VGTVRHEFLNDTPMNDTTQIVLDIDQAILDTNQEWYTIQ